MYMMSEYLINSIIFNLVNYLPNNLVVGFVDYLFNCFLAYFDLLFSYCLFVDLLFYSLNYGLHCLLYDALVIELYSCSLRILTYLYFFLCSCDFLCFSCLQINQAELCHLNLLILHLQFNLCLILKKISFYDF